TRGNSVQRVNLATGQVEQIIRVGVAPYTVLPVGDKVYVSNWGGDHPGKDDPQALSSDTPIRIDPKTGVANHGSVSLLEAVRGKWVQRRTIEVGLHPCGMIAGARGKLLYVANASSDTVSVIDTATDRVVETIRCRPEARLPFGSGCNALALGKDGATLYVANGTNNCIAVVALGTKARETPARDAPDASKLLGLIPTGWFPGAVQVTGDGKKLIVANVKGHGSLHKPKPEVKGYNSRANLGSLPLIDLHHPAHLRAVPPA